MSASFSGWSRSEAGTLRISTAPSRSRAGRFARPGRLAGTRPRCGPARGQEIVKRRSSLHPNAIIFLVGREKNAPGANFPDAVVDAVKVIASLHAQRVAKLDQMAVSGELKEICNAKKDQ